MDFNRYPVTLCLIIANVFFSLIGFQSRGFMSAMIGWPYLEKRKGQYYRLVTSGFMHADWMHLIFNMFTLFFFGTNLEGIFSHGLGGETMYLVLYFLGLICGNLPGYFKHSNNQNYRSLGASGAVSAVVFASIVFMPWATIQLYGVISMSAVIFAILYVVYCVYAGKRNMDNIGHDAHLWGSLFGLGFMLLIIGVARPDVFPFLVFDLQHPSLFGRPGYGAALTHLMSTR